MNAQMNSKPITIGGIVEIRSYCEYTGKVRTARPAKVLELLDDGTYYINIWGVGCGGGWKSWELHPVAPKLKLG